MTDFSTSSNSSHARNAGSSQGQETAGKDESKIGVAIGTFSRDSEESEPDTCSVDKRGSFRDSMFRMTQWRSSAETVEDPALTKVESLTSLIEEKKN